MLRNLSIWSLMIIPSAFSFSSSLYPTPGQIPPGSSTWTKSLNVTTASVAPYYLGCQRSNEWALTYDDGPGDQTTTALDDLTLNAIKGTFFVVGSSVLKHPDTLIRAFNEGHEIAIHTWSHPLLTQLTTDQIVAELVWTARLIKDLTGVTPALMRPPYGGVDDRVRQIIHAMGLKMIYWNRDSVDWAFANWEAGKDGNPPFNKNDTPTAITKQFKAWVTEPRKGTISLQHDIDRHPTLQIGSSASVVSQSGYRTVRISECIGAAPYDDDILDRVQFNPSPVIKTESISRRSSKTEYVEAAPRTLPIKALATETPILQDSSMQKAITSSASKFKILPTVYAVFSFWFWITLWNS